MTTSVPPPGRQEPPGYDVVVLAGGGSTRSGVADKTRAEVGGQELLARVVTAAGPAGRVVVVGEERPLPVPVLWTREQPPGGGPAAALAAGLALVVAPMVAVLAGDLPFLAPWVLARLALAAAGRDGAMAVDDEGRDQLLLGVWAAARLRAALVGVGDPAGMPLRSVLGGLAVRRTVLACPPGAPSPMFDCDTPADLELARRWA